MSTIMSTGTPTTTPSTRRIRLLAALSGMVGIILLGLYFGVGFAIGLATLPPTATLAQVVHLATQYKNLWFLGTWLQATGSMLSVIFFVALVHQAGATSRIAGMLTLLGSAVLLAVVLIEGVFTIDLAQAAANGHQLTALTSFDQMTVFNHIYPLAPAPLIFLALGVVLRGSSLLPRIFGSFALALGGLFAIVGLVGLFTSPILTLIPLALQSIWVLAAAVALIARAGRSVGVDAPTATMHHPVGQGAQER
jgi:hypothetical protein